MNLQIQLQNISISLKLPNVFCLTHHSHEYKLANLCSWNESEWVLGIRTDKRELKKERNVSFLGWEYIRSVVNFKDLSIINPRIHKT